MKYWISVHEVSLKKYNSRIHYSHGFSPSTLFLGIPLPSKRKYNALSVNELRNIAIKKLKKYEEKMKKIKILL